MKATPLFLGACALASVAGAVGGATTNTTPIQNAVIGMDILPERHVAFDPSDSGLPDVAPPDHYAMVTPQGRVEVAELSDRGLYSQRRYAWQDASNAPTPEPGLESGSLVPAVASAAPPPTIVAPPAPAPIAPLDLSAPASPPQEKGTTGQPRIIDVATELAVAG